MANLGARVKDIKKLFINGVCSENPQMQSRIQDALNILNDNLDNINDVWN